MSHETNTFALEPTTEATFQTAGILRGEEIIAQHAAASTPVAGFLEVGADPGVELVPLVFSSPNPSGTITRDAFEAIVGDLLARLRDRGPWDAVLLALHGAAVAEDVDETDGEIVARVRALVGPAVPIGVTLDLHANVGPRLVTHADVVTVFQTNPHVDAREQAAACGRLTVAAARGEIRPAHALVQVPAVIGIMRQNTAEEPMASIMAEAATIRRQPGVLSASVVEGFPYADVPHMGMATLVITDGDPPAARRHANALARVVWAHRAAFVARAAAPDDALRAADAAAGGPDGATSGAPVLLLDVGDNIGGGGPGDGTILLEAAIRLGIRGFLAVLFDPGAVAACVAAGVGATVALDVGGRRDARNGRPVAVTGRVRAITDGRYEDPLPTHGGYRSFDAGPTTVLDTDAGHTLLLTSRLVMPISVEQLRSAGVAPERLRILAAKGVVSPRAAYDRVTTTAILVETPGVTAADPTAFDHRSRRRPLFPWEPDLDFDPAD